MNGLIKGGFGGTTQQANSFGSTPRAPGFGASGATFGQNTSRSYEVCFVETP